MDKPREDRQTIARMSADLRQYADALDEIELPALAEQPKPAPCKKEGHDCEACSNWAGSTTLRTVCGNCKPEPTEGRWRCHNFKPKPKPAPGPDGAKERLIAAGAKEVRDERYGYTEVKNRCGLGDDGLVDVHLCTLTLDRAEAALRASQGKRPDPICNDCSAELLFASAALAESQAEVKRLKGEIAEAYEWVRTNVSSPAVCMAQNDWLARNKAAPRG